LREALPVHLASGPRVLKRDRGNDGQGIWKVETVASGDVAIVRAIEASSDTSWEEIPLDAFVQRCKPYFELGGLMVDQPYQERITDGMIRCYMAEDRVAGFAHQYPNGLLPPGHGRPHGEKRMFAPEAALFEALRARMEGEWVHQMMRALGLDRAALPVIWDADFLYGPRTGACLDTYVLCEINVSSVFAIPDEAPAAIADVTARRLKGRQPRVERTASG
jgi:hypothetical protein